MFGILYVILYNLIPDKYRNSLLRIPICCKLGFVVYDTSLFTANAISGRVVFARYWSSPSSRAYELLRLPSLPSGLASMIAFGSNGIPTGFACSIPSLTRMDLIYFFCDMITLVGFIRISIPTILEGSPRSVTSHLPHIISFMSDISFIDVANSSKSSIQTVMISKLSLCCLHTYMHGSKCNRKNPCFLTLTSNWMFHSHPDCFRPYRVFMSKQIFFVSSSNSSGWCI